MARTSKDRKNECRERLLSLLNPGDTVYGIVRSVSRSGMSRRIDFYVFRDNRPVFLTAYIADLLELTFKTFDSGALVHGCGMNMIFAVVYDLGQALWPDGTPTPHGKRNGEPDSCGGYALRHESL